MSNTCGKENFPDCYPMKLLSSEEIIEAIIRVSGTEPLAEEGFQAALCFSDLAREKRIPC